jgi:hypothetical protein
VEDTADFTYLGSNVAADRDGGGVLDIEQKIKKARGAFAKTKEHLESKQHNIKPQNGTVYIKLWIEEL